MCGNFESTTSWDDALVLHDVLNGSKSISNGFLGLSDGVVVWTLDQNGAGESVLDLVDEGVFILTEDLLINVSGPTEIIFGQIIDGVDLATTTSEWDSLTISLLCSSDTNDSVSGQNLEGWWVNTLLVDNDEVLVSAIAELSFKFNDLHNFVISELSLGFNELFSLLGVGPEESGVDLSLFVLKGDVEAEDIAVLHGRWEIRVSTTVVKNKTSNEFALSGHFVLHVHDLDHMEIDVWSNHFIFNLTRSSDGLNGINEDFTEWVSNIWVDLGVQGGTGNIDEELSVDFLSNFEFFEESKSLGLGKLHTLNKDSWMDTVSDVSLGLSHDFTDEKNVGGGSISDHIILSGGCSTNHGGSGVLNLHLVEENCTILGKLDLTSSTDEHLNGTLWSKVGFEDFLETFCGVDVDTKSLGLSDNISIGIYELKG